MSDLTNILNRLTRIEQQVAALEVCMSVEPGKPVQPAIGMSYSFFNDEGALGDEINVQEYDKNSYVASFKKVNARDVWFATTMRPPQNEIETILLAALYDIRNEAQGYMSQPMCDIMFIIQHAIAKVEKRQS